LGLRGWGLGIVNDWNVMLSILRLNGATKAYSRVNAKDNASVLFGFSNELQIK